MADKPRIIVGLDFGTTYSGVAWILEGSTDDPEVITSWPGGGNKTSQKVPTTISYKDSIKWGFQTPHSGEVLRAVKLLLHDGKGKRYTPALESKKIMKKMNKDAVEVIGEYLQKLVAHATELLDRRLGYTLDCMDLKYILTVPAVWSDKAKNSTLRAATSAGIESSKLSLVSEPEAAAIYCLNTLTHSIKKNDAVLVCDAGGGTVDLISYCVKEVKPLRLEEATEGTGGVCGSAALDKGFEELLKKLFGYCEYMSLSENTRNHAMQYWQESVKTSYEGDMDFSVPVPGANDKPQIHLEGGFLELDNNRIRHIFEPVMIDVEQLVRSQVRGLARAGHATKAIFLVGGFGSSEYLFRRLTTANPGTRVLQPPNAWSAVARGAVQHGLHLNQIESRIARRHYGVSHSSLYNPVLHGSDERYWDDLQEDWRIRNRMTWYIKKGQLISAYERVKMPFYRTVRLDTSLVFHDDLHFCNKRGAPDAQSKDVHSLCTVTANLSAVPKTLFTKRRNSKGVEYYEIWYDLALTLTSGGIVFELEFKGAPYGSVEAKY